LFSAVALAAEPPSAHHPSDKLVVHEWGTFTALQNEDGRAIGGINTDDEPLPSFVHDLHSFLLQNPSDVPPVYFKGAPRSHPDVYVRLETPVIYFYPPKGQGHLKLSVDVSFKGGWLTQFYPDALAGAPGLRPDHFDFGPINRDTVGTLQWSDLTVGGDVAGPHTDSKVWLAPRRVEATPVTSRGGESDKYLFYRGVGRIDAPLRISRDVDNSRLTVRSQWGDWMHLDRGFSVGPLWLVDVRGDGTTAYRTIDGVDISQGQDKALATLPAWFSDNEYSPDNLKALRRSLGAALVRDGLYDDEAQALLNTWEVSYFRRPGLRMFFMVPHQWTDHVLPLKISREAQIKRVMVGRIEIVTPAQRDALHRIGQGNVSDPRWLDAAMKKFSGGREDFYREEWYQQVMAGTKSLLSMDIEMPDDYRAYLSLGRFRNALILDEAAHNPTASLTQFIKQYDLQEGQVPGREEPVKSASAVR
jgi:hypothetical protein